MILNPKIKIVVGLLVIVLISFLPIAVFGYVLCAQKAIIGYLGSAIYSYSIDFDTEKDSEKINVSDRSGPGGILSKICGENSCLKRWKLDTAFLCLFKSCKIKKMKFIKWLRTSNSSDVNAVRIAYKCGAILTALIY